MSYPASYDDSSGGMLYNLFETNGKFVMHTPLLGDFYNERDDVKRGVTLGLIPAATDLKLADAFKDLDAYDSYSSFANLSACDICAFQPRDDCNVGVECLSSALTEFNRPPAVPEDSFFELEVTTFSVSRTSFARTMHDRLNGSLLCSSVTKVNPEKCTITACVFVDGLTCSIKIRCYQNHVEAASVGEESWMVEVQRRSGDCLAFTKAYRVLAGAGPMSEAPPLENQVQGFEAIQFGVF